MSSAALDRIVADKKARLARGDYCPSGTASKPSDGRRFLAALEGPAPRILAEIKARSPSAGEILTAADGKVETLALAYRRGHAAAISVVVEEDHFGGRPEWLPRARRISGLPALMKDFIVEERQLDFALSLGADAVLLIARVLDDARLAAFVSGARERGIATVVEAHDAEEIARAAAVAPDVLGVNARDLQTFETNLAELEALAPLLPEGPIRLAESGIASRAQIRRLLALGFTAFLVGEALLRAEDPEQALREIQSP